MRPLALAFALAFTAAGCGAFGSKAAGRDISEADQRWAEAASLQVSDFPAGWVESSPETDDAPPDECPSVDLSDLTVTGEGERAFDNEEAARFVLVARAVLASAEDARESVARGSGAELEECIRESFEAEAEREETEDFRVENVQAAEAAAIAVGELSRGFSLAFDYVFAGDERVGATLDILTFQRGRATVTLGFLGVAERFPPGLAERLARAADARVERDPPP